MALNTNKREGDKLHAEEWNELVQEVQGKQSRLNIVDALDSTSSVDVLSAKQGNILNNKIEDTKTITQGIETVIKTLPVGYFYGTFTIEEELPSEISEKGYAYVGNAPNYVIYTYEPTIGWRITNNKYSTPTLETDLESKSQTKAPTTKAVQEGIEAIDVTVQQSFTNSQKQTARGNIGAQENIATMQDVQPVVAALNDRVADVAPVTNEVKALGYKVLNPTLSFAEQVTDDNTVYEIRDNFSLGTEYEVELSDTVNLGNKKFISDAIELLAGHGIAIITSNISILDSTKSAILGETSYINLSAETVVVYLMTDYRPSTGTIKCRIGPVDTKTSTSESVVISGTTYYLTEAIQVGKGILEEVDYTGVQVLSDSVVLINGSKNKVVGSVSLNNTSITSFYLGCTESNINASCLLIEDGYNTISIEGNYNYSLQNAESKYITTAIPLQSKQTLHVITPNAKILNSNQGYLTGRAFYVNKGSNTTVYIASLTSTLKYIIGDGVTIPSNCKLKFNGGTISEGSLIANYQFSIEGSGLTETVILPDTFKYVRTSWFILNDTSSANTNKEILQNIVYMKYSFGMPTLICDSFTQIHVSDSIWIVKNLCITSECLYDRECSKLPKIIFDTGSFKWSYEYGTASNIERVCIRAKNHCLDIASYGGGECISFYNSFISNCGFYSEEGDCIHSDCITFSNRLENVSIEAPNGYGVYGFSNIDHVFKNFYVTSPEGNNPTEQRRGCKAVFCDCVGIFENHNIGDRNIQGFIIFKNAYIMNKLLAIRNSNFEMITGPVIKNNTNSTFYYELDNVSTLFYNTKNRGFENGIPFNLFDIKGVLGLKIRNYSCSGSLATGYYRFNIATINANPVFDTDADITLNVNWSNSGSILPLTVKGVQATYAYPTYYKTFGPVKIEKLRVGSNDYVPLLARTDTMDTLPSSDTIGYTRFLTDLKKPVWWDGSAWVDANGETVGLQVNDTTVLLAAAASSSKTINVYSSSAITATTQNPDESTTNLWLTASVGTLTNGAYPVTLTATSANSTNPRGAKVIISNGTDVVIVNVVQNYSTT